MILAFSFRSKPRDRRADAGHFAPSFPPQMLGVVFFGFARKIEGDSWFSWWFNYLGHLFPLKGHLWSQRQHKFGWEDGTLLLRCSRATKMVC